MIVNEAFWIMYLVDLVSGIPVVAGVTIGAAIMGMVGTAIWASEGYGDDKDLRWKKYQRVLRNTVIVSLVCTLIIAFTPSSRTIYSGAAQTVVETTELDDTLVKLKELVDAKIEGLIDSE